MLCSGNVRIFYLHKRKMPRYFSRSLEIWEPIGCARDLSDVSSQSAVTLLTPQHLLHPFQEIHALKPINIQKSARREYPYSLIGTGTSFSVLRGPLEGRDEGPGR